MRRAPSLPSRAAGARRAFSLIELLLAIFILGIGVISIAALFPAGIAQQEQAVDDSLGTSVAHNALAVLRTTVRPEDFGLTLYDDNGVQRGQVDFGWSRPAFLTSPDPVMINGVTVPPGSISIFDGDSVRYGVTVDGDLLTDNVNLFSPATVCEVPYNSRRYPNGAPVFVLTPGDRSYPMVGAGGNLREAQYHWDCMFRRFGGRVQVAIFVYRVIEPPGDRNGYLGIANPSDPAIPTLPVALDLGQPWSATLGPDATLPVSDPYDPTDQAQSWQQPRQMIVDENGAVHRVLGRYEDDGSPVIELQRPVPEMANLPVYRWRDRGILGDNQPPGGNGLADENVVQSIWYIPAEAPASDEPSRRLRLVPVHVLIEDL